MHESPTPQPPTMTPMAHLARAFEARYGVGTYTSLVLEPTLRICK